MKRTIVAKVFVIILMIIILSGCTNENKTGVEIRCDIAMEAIERASEVMKTIAAGSTLSFAIKEDGGLWVWAPDLFGQMEDVVAISAEELHVLILKKDGSLWAWGENTYGQLGNDTNIYLHNPPVKIMEDVIAISTGSRQSAAIKSDGSLWVWGRYIQYFPTQVMENVIAVSVEGGLVIKADESLWQANFKWTDFEHIMNDVATISSGYSHFMAIRTDGSLWAWGDNWSGQLGDRTNKNKDTPVRIMENVIAVSAGMNYTMAIQADGSLWGWGRNRFGELGNGTNENTNTPFKIMENVVAVSTGGIGFDRGFMRPFHTIALREDRTLWSWGAKINIGFGDENLPHYERMVIPLPPKQIMEGLRVP